MLKALAGLAVVALMLLSGCGQPVSTPAGVTSVSDQTKTLSVTGPRVALLIANADYKRVARLKNPESDMALMARTLRAAGYEVFETRNADRAAFIRAMQGFRDRADESSVALIYYAGHGMEVNGRNWLIPVDATLTDERDLPVEAVDLDGVLATVEGAKGLRIVVLDACRDNPFVRSMRRIGSVPRAISRGLGEVEASGTLVVYAAKAGSTADDGDGANSPFASSLAQRFAEPVDVRILFAKVRDDVLAATAKRQEPYNYGSLPGINLYLVPPRDEASRAPLSANVVETPDATEWAYASRINTVASYKGYLERFPEGAHASEATATIGVLELSMADDNAWASAASGSVDAVRRYLAAYPTGLHRADANARLQTLEAAAKSRAYQAGTSAALTAFLRDWPDASGADQVRRDITRFAAAEKQKASVVVPKQSVPATTAPAAPRLTARGDPHSACEAKDSEWRTSGANSTEASIRGWLNGVSSQCVNLIAVAKTRLGTFPGGTTKASTVCPTSPFVVYFEWDRFDLTSANRDTINAAIARGRSCRIQQVLIEGHSDTYSSAATAMRISERRASVVKQAFVAGGVSESLIATVARGETEPAEPTVDGVREPLNRRAEVAIVYH